MIDIKVEFSNLTKEMLNTYVNNNMNSNYNKSVKGKGFIHNFINILNCTLLLIFFTCYNKISNFICPILKINTWIFCGLMVFLFVLYFAIYYKVIVPRLLLDGIKYEHKDKVMKEIDFCITMLDLQEKIKNGLNPACVVALYSYYSHLPYDEELSKHYVYLFRQVYDSKSKTIYFNKLKDLLNTTLNCYSYPTI